MQSRDSSLSSDTVCMSTLTYQGHEILYTREQIAERVAQMGAQITHDLNGEKLVMIGVLKGAAPFLSDLARAIDADATFDFVAVSSYGKGQRSSGAVKMIKDLDQPIEGKNVLVVEDILDTGLTLAYLRKLFMQQHPKTLRIATLLDKPSRRIEKIEADYVGFSIPFAFALGALPKNIWHFADPPTPATPQHLYQKLIAQWAKLYALNRATPNDEVTAHRIADSTYHSR